MKTNDMLRYLAMAGIMLMVACDTKKTVEEPAATEKVSPSVPDTALVDTLALQPEDGVAVATPADTIDSLSTPLGQVAEKPVARTPVKQSQQEKPAPVQSEKPREPEGDVQFREGMYKLASVQGEALPMVMDMTTECDTRLMNGTLDLKNGQFRFESNTEESCKGEPGKGEKHEATGSYRLEGKQIFLNIRYGDALGDASGIVEAGNRLRLQQIGNGEEQQTVDWVFALQ